MTGTQVKIDAEDYIRDVFFKNDIEMQKMERRDYPGETVFVIFADDNVFTQAAELGNKIDAELSKFGLNGFVAVRKSEANASSPRARAIGVSDPKVDDLVNLIISRSRASEVQPSLSYVRDATNNLSKVIVPRHHLIFGRRGVGKTSLMVEAKHAIERNGHQSVWVNLQTLRHESAARAFLFISQRICELIQSFYQKKERAPQVLASATLLHDEIEKMVSNVGISVTEINLIIPRMQMLIKRFTEVSPTRMYLFLDELHYLPLDEQPKLLDMIHGAVRDADAWLKIAGIKHISRWFQPSPPMGLQTGHDADHIDLDITLEDPSRAKKFLEEVLQSYTKHVNISALKSIFSTESLDRLVIASGAVPRDYLVLSTGAINQARKREKGKIVGVQDVNKAAGDAAKIKIAELEDDAASAKGTTRILEGLKRIRSFCIDEKGYTYFRVDFRDKESRPNEYEIVQGLMDLRLVHLVDASLSDEKEAGRKSEVYMLDLSQFSGHRLRRHIKVLDFESRHLVLKDSGTNVEAKVGKTPRERLGLLRRGPLFELSSLAQ